MRMTDIRTDGRRYRRTDGQNYDSKDRDSIAVSRGKKWTHEQLCYKITLMSAVAQYRVLEANHSQ